MVGQIRSPSDVLLLQGLYVRRTVPSGGVLGKQRAALPGCCQGSRWRCVGGSSPKVIVDAAPPLGGATLEGAPPLGGAPPQCSPFSIGGAPPQCSPFSIGGAPPQCSSSEDATPSP